jgi:hypothetical protein
MKQLAELTKSLSENKFKYLNLKLEIDEMETKAYLKWKEENPKDRTAKEKIVDMLRTQDVLWESKSITCEKVRALYEKDKIIYNVILEMLKNPQFTKTEIEEFIENTKLNLGEEK